MQLKSLAQWGCFLVFQSPVSKSAIPTLPFIAQLHSPGSARLKRSKRAYIRLCVMSDPGYA